MARSPDVAPPLSTTLPTVVCPVGELDVATGPELTRALDAALGAGREVVLDLRQLDFMDVRGMHVVLAVDHRARQAGRRFVVIRGGPSVDTVFALTGAGGRVAFVELGPEAPAVAALDPQAAPRPRLAAAELAPPAGGADTINLQGARLGWAPRRAERSAAQTESRLRALFAGIRRDAGS